MKKHQNSPVIRPSDLPSPPKAALQILRISSQAEVNNEELARLVTNDPMMTAELLRVVNSAFFGLSREISSIKQAITILGTKSLRNLALCISARDVIKTDDMPGFAIDLFWEDSLRRASCARLLGTQIKADPDECFTAGLLQDFGLLVLFFLNKDKSHLWLEFRLSDPEERYRLEIDNFYTTHDAMILTLADAWGLPQDLVLALGDHHKLQHKDLPSKLPAILKCADWLASVYSVNNTRNTINTCRQYAKELLGVNDEILEMLLVAIPEATENAASALGLRIAQQTDFEQLMKDANVKLAEENLDYQEITWRLEQALKERDTISAELNRELQIAQEIQRSLLPEERNGRFPVTGLNIPARLLSGDFYDFFEVEEDKIFFNLGDVSGKGVSAALLTTKISSLFRCLGKTVSDLKQLFHIINNEICDTSTRGMFVTMIAGTYDPKSGNIKLVNAGHPPALFLQSDGKLQSFEACSVPLGIVNNTQFNEYEFNLSGGCLYLYSDGVIEGKTDTGAELGVRGLLTNLLALRNKAPIERFMEIVALITASHDPLHDDVTLLSVEKK